MWGIFLVVFRYASNAAARPPSRMRHCRLSSLPGDGTVNLSWMFGSSMQPVTCFTSTLGVVIQGGYCAWVAWHWFHTRNRSRRRGRLGHARRHLA